MNPELSVILVADGLEQARETLRHLRAQTAAARIEILLVTNPGRADGDGADPPLPPVRVIEAESRASSPAARAAAVTAARAPLIAMAETHCFPEPDWAEALIEAHRGPWAAVGPEIDNENPKRPASWANLFVDYAAWIAPVAQGPTDDLPGHNSSYKRSLLLEYGDDLARFFESESVMHWDLRSRGHALFAEPRARVRHRNMTLVMPSIIEHFHAGRCFAALRSREWHPARRALYAIASPLIPVIRLRRVLRHVRRTDRREILPSALPMMLSSLIAHATGEMAGYLTGAGDAARGMTEYELDKSAYVEA